MTAVAGGSKETPESSGGLLAQPASRAADKEVTTAIRLKDTPMRASLTHHGAVRNEQRLTPPRNLCPYPTNAVFRARFRACSCLSRTFARSIGEDRICRQERAKNASLPPLHRFGSNVPGDVPGGRRRAWRRGDAGIPRSGLQQYLCAEARRSGDHAVREKSALLDGIHL